MRRLTIILIAFILSAIGLLAYYYLEILPRIKRAEGKFDHPEPEDWKEVSAEIQSGNDFDIVLALQADPLGIVWHGNEFVIGNRQDPWGFVRLKRSGPNYEFQKVPVIENDYGQRMGFSAVTWNGKNYVTYTDAAWFQRQGNVFVIHDPVTLRVLDWFAAPDLLGCLAWDGENYWAATRRNTADSPEPAFLYQLDSKFHVVQKQEPPDIGCQGLAWDGEYLWFVDVFSDQIHVLDVAANPVELIKSYTAPFDYLSGIAFDGRAIWVSEYDEDKLHRLNPVLRSAWLGRDEEEPPEITDVTVAEQPGPARNSYTNSLADTGPESADLLELAIEIRDGTLYGTWKIYFGDQLFEGIDQESEAAGFPTFARYTVNISGGSLDREIEKEFEAVSGETTENDIELADGLGPGEYEVWFFLHVQYVNSEGMNRIVNKSTSMLRVRY